MKHIFSLSVCLALIFTALIGSMAQAQTSYSFHDLGTLGGPYSYANAVNYTAQVVGAAMWSRTGSDLTRDVHAFYWSSTTGMRDLGTLGGRSSIANSINNAGEVVGRAEYDPTVFAYHAFYWTTATGTLDLNTFLSPADRATWTLVYANDINDNHQVVGVASVSVNGTTESHNYMLDIISGTLTDLGTAGAQSINNAGQIVGGSTLYNGGFPLISLSPLGARDINNTGAIVGELSNGDAGYRAPDGTLIDLGRFATGVGTQSVAYSINNATTPVIVGMSSASTKQGPVPCAFRWRPGDAAITNLNSMVTNLGKYVLRDARGVSDTGCIAGAANNSSTYSLINEHAYLLTPQ